MSWRLNFRLIETRYLGFLSFGMATSVTVFDGISAVEHSMRVGLQGMFFSLFGLFFFYFSVCASFGVFLSVFFLSLIVR